MATFDDLSALYAELCRMYPEEMKKAEEDYYRMLEHAICGDCGYQGKTVVCEKCRIYRTQKCIAYQQKEEGE